MSQLINMAAKSRDPAIKKLYSTFKMAKDVGAPAALIESLEECLSLSGHRTNFEENTTTTDSDTCKKITEVTLSHDWPKVHQEGKTTWNCSPGMLSGRVESQFLKSFLSATKAKQVLEIGMYTGYTAISVAEALPDDGKVTTIDQDEYLKNLVLSLIEGSPHKHKVQIEIGNALDIMAKMKSNGQTFDTIFLDAAKSEYEAYLKLCIEGNLLRPNGTVLVDNAFMHGSGYLQPESASAKFAEVIKNDPKLHVVLVPIKDGIFVIRRRSEVDGDNV